ncbi:MAG: Type 1 glutamine amidotransferase-like domain-containing protein [Clostridia bacterium]|nr:Type 1 glutamine amidotransferase-like domain-containing protein [Clostridia bacterium]
MKVMLTSCGIETETIRQAFLHMLAKSPAEARALFIPTAANDADAIAVLPECMNDLIKCGIPKEQIQVFDLHRNMHISELHTFDVVYLCGGSTAYLLERINGSGFREALLAYIAGNGLVIGVSAGSVVFANNLPGNLGLLDAKLLVHCKSTNMVGKVTYPLPQTVELSNTAAMLLRTIPTDVEVIDGENN